jgi:hypothetical protein
MELNVNFHHRYQASMLSPSSSTRVRTSYLWDRIHSDNTVLDDVVLHEKPVVPILRVLLEMNRDHPDISSNMDSLTAYLKLARDNHGDIMATYKQKDLSGYATDDYVGCMKIGRSYPAATATFLPKEVVNTMWKDTHVEVDLVASYPTMLVSCFRDVTIPTLASYVSNPSPIITGFHELYGVNRSELKRVINTTICSYPKVPGDLGIGFSDDDKIRMIVESGFYKGIMNDLKAIAEYVHRHYKPFLNTIKNKCEASGDPSKLDRVMGCALSHICGDAENVVMRCIIGFLSENDTTNKMLNDCIWKFDGILVSRDMADPGLTSRIERRVLEKTGISVTIAIRPLEGTIALSVNPEEMNAMTSYETWKQKFEKMYIAMVRPAGYCRIWPDGSLQDLKKQEFDILTEAEDREMMKLWHSDPAKKKFLGRDFAPEPLFIGDGYYNLWRGMAASRLPANDTPVDISMYMNHVALLMGGGDEQSNPAIGYMHKLLAFKFQRPGDIWRVMVFIRSVQGVGKDIWLDFLFSLIGFQYGTRLMKVADIAGQYNSALEGRLLVGFSEMDPKDCRENMETLKEMITATRVTIKKKYVSSYDINNSTCFIGFSNNYNAIKITTDDRRIFAVTASGCVANKKEYHEPLIEYLKRTDVKRAVYDYYMGMDITDFNPSGDRPITETMEDMAMDSICIGDVFLKTHFHNMVSMAHDADSRDVKLIDDGKVIRIKKTLLMDQFALLASEFRYKDCDSRRKMSILGSRLLKEASSRIEMYFEAGTFVKPISDYKSHGQSYFNFNIALVMKYIQEKLGGTEDREDGGGFVVGRE